MNALEKIALVGILSGAITFGVGMYQSNKFTKGFGQGMVIASGLMGGIGYNSRIRNLKELNYNLLENNPPKNK